MDSRVHWLKQSFLDPDVEREYLAHVATEGRTHYRAATIVSVGLWMATIASDRQVGGTTANFHHLALLRFLIVPLLIPVILVGWTSPARFARLWHPAGWLGGALVVSTIVVMAATAPDPEAFGFQSGLTGYCIAMVALHALMPLSFVSANVLCVPASIAYFAVLTTRYDHPASIVGTWLFLANLLGATISLMLERNRRNVFHYGRMLSAERARSDALLMNLLPAPIAERLRIRAETIAESFDHATVMFADLVGFTPLAARLPPDRIVATLDQVFSRFDELAKHHGLEKIKTIGDAYMLVSGIPTPREDHAVAAADMAIAMRDLVASLPAVEGTRLSLRIGLHSGPVVAGVIGRTRPFYDLWGDTVNTASRMESHGIADGIQVTEAVHALIEARFVLEERGAIPIKGKGEMRTFLVTGRR